MFKIGILLFFILLIESSFAQVDSLKRLLYNTKTDSTIVDLTTEIGWFYIRKGEFESAFLWSEKAKKAAENYKDPNRLEDVYKLKAFYFGGINNRPKCLENHFQRIKILEKLEPSQKLAGAYYETAAVLKSQGYSKEAERYFNKCNTVSEQVGYQLGAGLSLMPLSELMLERKEYEGAKSVLHKSYSTLIDDFPSYAAYALSNLALAYAKQDSLKKAQYYINKAIVLIEEADEKGTASFIYQAQGEIFRAGNKNKEALVFLYKSKAIWEKSKGYFYLQGLYLEMARAYAGINSDSTATYYEKHLKLRDDVNNTDNNEQIAEMEVRFQSEKKEQEISLLSKEKQIANLTKQKQNQILWIVAICGIVLLFLAVFLASRMRIIWNQRNKIDEQKKIVEEKSKEMHDSIRYAKRIQGAALPQLSRLKQQFNDSFVIYLPKDELSGDFYWTGTIMRNNEEWDVMALGDCTGHGVPGALLSILGINYLNMGQSSNQIDNPSEILNFLNKGIHTTFSSLESQIRDGMDIAVIAIDRKRNVLEYAAAKNSIFVIRKNEMFVLKGNRHAIGKVNGSDLPELFSNFEFQLEKGDVIYLSSDGYVDQFGGEHEKKFGSKEFKNNLMTIHENDMEDQKMVLEKIFKEWKKDVEQLDDVCLIGVRI